MIQRFHRYCDKVFSLTRCILIIRDDRPKPFISSQAVWLFALFMFASKTRSLHAAECRSRTSNDSKSTGVRCPSADTLGRVFARMDTESLRQILSSINHKLKRNKSLKSHQKLFFAAVDGHELFKSKSRCCEGCLIRKLTVNDQAVTEYYHRITVCHLVGSGMALPLDAEPILPGEDEKASAKRLLERIFKTYSRFFDVVIGDALYLDRSFVNFVRSHHKHLITVLKDNNSSLLEDAQGLFKAVPPKVKRKDPSEEVVIWDEENFQTREECLPLRIIYSQEKEFKTKQIAGKRVQVTEEHHRWWATTLPQTVLGSESLRWAARRRWEIENNLFGVLSIHWSMDHCFKHHPTAILNFILTLFTAFILVQSFYQKNLKAPFRDKLTLITLGDLLFAGLIRDIRPALWRPPPRSP